MSVYVYITWVRMCVDVYMCASHVCEEYMCLYIMWVCLCVYVNA